MIELADLSGLQFLKEIKTPEQYASRVNGPYRVGRIIDEHVFTAPMNGRDINRQSWFGILNSDIDISQAQKKLIEHIIGIDIKLGFQGKVTHGDYDQRGIDNHTQRCNTDRWHQDSFGKQFGGSAVVRIYVVSSCYGTEYVPEGVTRNNWRWENAGPNKILDRFPNSFKGYDTGVRGKLKTMKPFDIYLMTGGVWHRAQRMPTNLKRAFLRLTMEGT
jgi:hypothetical protein